MSPCTTSVVYPTDAPKYPDEEYLNLIVGLADRQLAHVDRTRGVPLIIADTERATFFSFCTCALVC